MTVIAPCAEMLSSELRNLTECASGLKAGAGAQGWRRSSHRPQTHEAVCRHGLAGLRVDP